MNNSLLKFITDKVKFTTVQGDVEVETVIRVNGEIVETIPNNRNTKTKITIEGNPRSVSSNTGDIQVNGDVDGDVESLSGNITCGNVKGSVETMSGDIQTKRIEGPRIETMSGDVTIS